MCFHYCSHLESFANINHIFVMIAPLDGEILVHDMVTIIESLFILLHHSRSNHFNFTRLLYSRCLCLGISCPMSFSDWRHAWSKVNIHLFISHFLFKKLWLTTHDVTPVILSKNIVNYKHNGMQNIWELLH